MARGGGSIQYIPPDNRPPAPGILEVLMQAAPSFLQAYISSQALKQQSALAEQAIADNQMQLDQQAGGNQQAFAALAGALRDPNRGELTPQTQAQVQSAIPPSLGDARQRVNMGQTFAQAPAALASVQADMGRNRNRQAFAAARTQYSADPDMLPAFDAIATLITEGQMTPGEAISAAQAIGLPRNKAEKLAVTLGEAQLRQVESAEESDRLSTGLLVGMKLLPEGTENFVGASDWIRTINVLNKQHDQNLALQSQAHANQKELLTTRQSVDFATLFQEKMIDLIPTLTAPQTVMQIDPETGQIGEVVTPGMSPTEVADYIDGLAGEYGVQLPRVQRQMLLDEATKGAVISEAIQAHTIDVQQGLKPGESLAQIRQQLMQDFGDAAFVAEVMRGVKLPQPSAPATPAAAPANAGPTPSTDPLANIHRRGLERTMQGLQFPQIPNLLQINPIPMAGGVLGNIGRRATSDMSFSGPTRRYF